MSSRSKSKSGASNRPVRKPDAFMLAYAEWLGARARLNKLDASGYAGLANSAIERRMGEALDAARAAAWQLIQTPAGSFANIRFRAAFVEALFTDADHFGVPVDGCHRLALAQLVREVCRYTGGAQ